MRWRLVAGAAAVLAAAFAGRRLLDAAREEPSPAARTYTLEREAFVPAPVEEVARFFEDVRNLALITPPSYRFRIIDIDGPIRPGMRIEYEVRPLGFPQRVVATVVEHEPGRRFVDTQTHGPYRYWRHEHTFEPVEGGTRVRDRIEYQLPFGPLGRAAHALLVARQLRDIFDYRARVVEERFG